MRFCQKNILLLIIIVATPLAAQKPYGELGFNFGGMNYIGDLNNQSMFSSPSMAYSGYVRYNLGDRWAGTITLAKGSVECLEDYLPSRNLSFRSDIWEASARVEFNFVRFGDAVSQNRVSPFIFVGMGVFHYNPEALYTDALSGEQEWVYLLPLGTEGQNSTLYPDRKPYQTLCFMMPFGMGLKYMPLHHIVLSVEYGFRKTWTDYLDDVSTAYPDPAVFDNDEVALALYDRSPSTTTNIIGTKRGDDSLDDWYAYFNISLTISTKFLFGWMKPKRCYHR